MLVLLQVVLQRGEHSARQVAALPLVAAVHAVEELRKGRVREDRPAHARAGGLGQVQEAAACVLDVQLALRQQAANCGSHKS